MGAIIVYALQILLIVIGLAIELLIVSVTAMVGGSGTNVEGIREIFFNHSSLTTAAFFATEKNKLGLQAEYANIWVGNNPMALISSRVTQYYYIFRNLSIAILLFVLLYIGIRMAISTVGSDQAKYKKMLVNWVISLALVFVLHFIMVGTFYINNVLVSIFDGMVGSSAEWEAGELLVHALVPIDGFGYAIIYFMIEGMMISYIIMYIKRIIVLAFLILIAPLITITYAIDKIGDGRSQALNTWLKEFIYNVIIQPFHCVLYIVLIRGIIDMASDKYSLGAWIIYIIVLKFVQQAEDILKKIFGIRADSMPTFSSAAALGVGIASTFGKLGKDSSGVSKKEMPKVKGELGGTSSTSGGSTTVRTTQQQTPTQTGATPQSGTQTTQRTATQQDSQRQQTAQQQAQQQQVAQQQAQEQQAQQQQAQQQQAAQQQAVQQQAGQQQAQEKKGLFRRIIGTPDDFAKGVAGAARFIAPDASNKPKEIAKGVAGAVGKAAAGIAVGAMTYGSQDLDKSVGLGLMAYGMSDKIGGAIREVNNMQTHELNEEKTKKLYADYVEDIQAMHADDEIPLTETQINEELIEMIKGNISYAGDDPESKKKREMMEQVTALKKSYSMIGSSDANDDLLEFVRPLNHDEIRKVYSRDYKWRR